MPKTELKEQLGRMFKINDNNCVFVFGFKTDFGGGKSTGFALIYDNMEKAKKYEPKYRLIRVRGNLLVGGWVCICVCLFLVFLSLYLVYEQTQGGATVLPSFV